MQSSTVSVFHRFFGGAGGARAAARGLALAGGLLLSHAVGAQSVQVDNAWVRATVPGQTATGAFMRLTAASQTRLVSVSTPAAAFAEVHEMRMENNVMKMSALKDGVELKPGSFHVMLMDLKQPLPTGSTIALTLVFRDAKGVEQRSELKLPVNAMAPMSPLPSMAPMAPMDHSH